MVDEKLDDQVWVTVVATGYGDAGRRKSIARLQEPAGEPRIQRAGASRASERERVPLRASAAGERRGGLDVEELDVPEFIPSR